MRLRNLLVVFLLLISLFLHILIFNFIGIINTDNDLAFEYDYHWHLSGTDGTWYEGYSEDLYASGIYRVDFNEETNIAQVNAVVTWRYRATDGGSVVDSDSSRDTYDFTYSLINGSYLSGDDQDYDAVGNGEKVWFHIPDAMQSTSYDILDDNYEVSGKTTYWIFNLLPTNSIKLSASGTYIRDDVYGNYSCSYTTSNYFTNQGYLIAEKYYEYAYGYEGAHYTEFSISSTVQVKASSYARNYDILTYFMVYWSPILLIWFGMNVGMDWLLYRPRKGIYFDDKTGNSYRIKIDKKLPQNFSFKINSEYCDCFDNYITRSNANGAYIVTARDEQNKSIYGIGFIEKSKLGTFFGNPLITMLNYSRVKYAFIEDKMSIDQKTIEEYNVYEINDLLERDFSYDTTIVKPFDPFYLESIIRMISYNDFGKIKYQKYKWLDNIVKTDIVMIAIAHVDEPWVQRILNAIAAERDKSVKDYGIFPEMIDNSVILGVGFATPCKEVGWLYGLQVHPAFRNIGIGKNLALARLSALKQLGINKAITEIAEANLPANAIFADEEIQAKKVGSMKLVGKDIPNVKVRRH